MRFHEMTFPELRRVPRDKTVLLAPIAACEQHSHHLAVFTDTVLCTGVAEGVEQKMPQQVLLLPPDTYGSVIGSQDVLMPNWDLIMAEVRKHFPIT